MYILHKNKHKNIDLSVLTFLLCLLQCKEGLLQTYTLFASSLRFVAYCAFHVDAKICVTKCEGKKCIFDIEYE